MKLLPIAALAAAAAAVPAAAQDAHAGHADHAGHVAQPAPAAGKLTVESPIEALMANAAAKAVVEVVMPGIDQHPAYDQFRAMSLKQVQPFSNGMITDEMLAKIAAGLAELK